MQRTTTSPLTTKMATVPIPAAVAVAVLFFGVLVSSGAKAQAPASYPGGPMPASSSPGPTPASDDCSTELLGLSQCLTYVEAGSNLTVPDKGCCPGLAGLVDAAPQCLCQLLGSGEVFGLPIDKVKSLKLPTACHVSTPPVSLCAVFGIPVASPTGPSSAPTSGGPSSPSSGLGLPGVHPPSLAPATKEVGSGFRNTDVSLLLLLSIAGVVALVIF